MPRIVSTPSVDVAITNVDLAGIYTTQQVTALTSGLPVDGAGAYLRTMARVVVPVDAGDTLVMSGRQRVTNDIGPTQYVVGVGFWWDAYDADDGVASGDAAKVWTRISSLDGQNVDRPLVHHLALTLAGDTYKIPANWPAGHRIVICFRACAASTAWNSNSGNDKVTVDDYGSMTVLRFRPHVDDPRWDENQGRLDALDAQVADLAAQVAALTTQEG